MTDIPTTREALVRATRDAIRDVGMPALTTREIASRAGANLAAIPYYFGTKDALVAEALVAEAHDLVAPVFTVLASDRPPAERVQEAIGLLNDTFDTYRDRVPVYLAALASAPHTPEVARGLAGLWGDLRDRLTETVVDQQAGGLVPPWVSPDAVAALILAVVNGVVVAEVVDPGGPGHREVAAELLKLLLASNGNATG